MKTTPEQRGGLLVKLALLDNGRFVGLDALWASKIRDLIADIEELEARQITDEQIDRAWQHRNNYAYGFRVLEAVEGALGEFYIVRCKECGGEGKFEAAGLYEDCEACSGHGWVRKERGDEDDG